jgi:hypothetical protein
MESVVTAAAHRDFKATYSTAGSLVIVFAQMGGHWSFAASPTTDYNDGTTDTVCDTSSGTPVCTQDARPLTGQLSIINPTQTLAMLSSVPSKGVTHSTKSNGDRCISYPVSGGQIRFCVNTNGIVTTLSIPQGSIQLKSYSTDVTEADVSVPSGATMEPAAPAPAS